MERIKTIACPYCSLVIPITVQLEKLLWKEHPVDFECPHCHAKIKSSILLGI